MFSSRIPLEIVKDIELHCDQKDYPFKFKTCWEVVRPKVQPFVSMGIFESSVARKKVRPSPCIVWFCTSMTKEKWVLKSEICPEALSHNCRDLKYVARPFNACVSLLPVSWMAWFFVSADQWQEISELKQLKLVRLKAKEYVKCKWS